MTKTTATVAERLFANIEAGDIAGVAVLYHDEIAVWHNFDDTTQTKSENLRVLAGLIEIAPRRRYEVIERHTIGERFIQRHVLHCTTAGGADVAIPACIFITVREGTIRRIDEYLDIAQTKSLRGPRS